MLLKMVEVAAFLVFAPLAWYFLYRVVPEMGRRVTLALLHNRRDRLYELRKESPIWEDSLIYQDMLFSLTALIHVVRDESRRVSVPVLASVLWSKSPSNGDDDWRSQRYDCEIEGLFAGEDRKKELLQAWQVFREKDLVLSLFVITSHPFLFVSAMGICLVSVLLAPIGYYYGVLRRQLNRIDVKAVERTLEPIRMYQNGEAVGWLLG